MASCAGISGVVLLGIGTALALIGIATIDWMEAPAKVTYYKKSYSVLNLPAGSTCRVGLWEHCCTAQSQNHCAVYSREVPDWVQAVRILLAVSVFLLVISLLLMICSTVKHSWQHSFSRRMGISYVFSLGAVTYLSLVISYTLLEYSKEDGMFTIASNLGESVKLSWSFYVSAAGAIINPVAIFIICAHWHHLEDEDPGWNSPPPPKWSGSADRDAATEFSYAKENPNVLL